MNGIGNRIRQQLLIAALLTIVGLYGFAAFGSLINTPINLYAYVGRWNTSMNCSSTFGSDSITWFFKPAGDGANVTIASGSRVSMEFIQVYWIDQPTANESNLIISRPTDSSAGTFTCADKEMVAHAELLLPYNLTVSTNASDNLVPGDVIGYTCQLVYVANPFFIPIFSLYRYSPCKDDLDNTTSPQLEQSGSVMTATATFYQPASCLSSFKMYECMQTFGQPVGYLSEGSATNAPSAFNSAGFQPVKVTCLHSTGDPLYGPIAGGTVVTLTLDDWSKQYSEISAVYLGGILQAIDLQSDRSSNSVEMTTPIATAELIGQPLPIIIEFTPGPYNITTNLSFTYKDNPEITGISPSTFVVTGGTIVNVTGFLLTSVANPFIRVTIAVERGIERNTTSEKFFQPCEVQVEDGFQMTCRMPSVNIPDDFLQVLDALYTSGYGRDNSSTYNPYEETPFPPTTAYPPYPPVTHVGLNRRKRFANALFVTGPNGVDQLVISLGFVLDGYQKYDNINDVLPDTQILLFSPPEISFTTDIVEFDPDKDESISIKGMHMTRGCRIVDYEVEVGADDCENLDLTDNQLRCRPPNQQPQMTNKTSIYCDQLLSINIRLGFKTYQYACMKYSTHRPLALIIGLAVGLSSFVIIILLIIVIVCCCKRSRNRRKKLADNTLNIHGATVIEANEPPSDRLNATESYLQLSTKPYDYDAYIKPSELQSCNDEPYLRPSSKLYAEEEYESPSDQLYTNALELK